MLCLSIKPFPQLLSSCREGLAQPPQVTSFQPLGELWKPKASSSLQRLHPTNKSSTSTDRKTIEHQSLSAHQVFRNIKLSEGGRLETKRKRQIDPHFDIQFTDLKIPGLDDAPDLNGMDHDSDDLPEVVLPAVGKEDMPWLGLPHSEMAAASSKPTKTVLSSRTFNFDLVDEHPTKRIKTTVVSIRSSLC